MSWQGEMGTIVRHLINDVDASNYTYSDDRIETTILVACQLVMQELKFDNTYNVDVEQCRLTPDPTDPSTSPSLQAKDDGFINIASLKASCIILGSELKTQSLNSVRVTDGPSSVDYTSVAKSLQFLYEFSCKKYDEYKLNFQMGNSNVGQAILSPYSPGSYSMGSYGYNHQR